MPEESTRSWETVIEDTVLTTPEFDVVEETVRLPDGTESEFVYVDEPPAVVILPVTPSGDVVVLNEWRHAVRHTSHGVPAGTVDDGETVPDAAHRELREETGYEAESIDPLITVEPANGVSNTVHHHVVATDCRPTGIQSLDPDETITVDTRSLSALREEVRSGAIRDGRTALAIMVHAFRNP